MCSVSLNIHCDRMRARPGGVQNVVKLVFTRDGQGDGSTEVNVFFPGDVNTIELIKVINNQLQRTERANGVTESEG